MDSLARKSLAKSPAKSPTRSAVPAAIALFCWFQQPVAAYAESSADAVGDDHLAALLIRHDLRYVLQPHGNARPECSRSEAEAAR